MKFAAFFILLFTQIQVFAQLNFADGSLSLKQNEENKFGFVDAKGTWIIQAIYEDARELPNVNAAIVKVDYQYRFIDSKGNFINDWKLDVVYLSQNSDKVLCYAKMKGKWGAIGIDFQEIIPFQYEIEAYNEWTNFHVDGSYSYLGTNDPLVCRKHDNYGVINSKNDILLAFQYQQIRLIRGISGQIERYALKQNDKWAICKIGETQKAAFIYDDYLEIYDDSIRIVQKKNQWYFLNVISGKEKTTHGDEPEKLQLDVWKEGKWGKMNGLGKLLLPFVSDWTMGNPQIYSKYTFKNNLNHDFTLHYGLLGLSGIIILEPDYEEIEPAEDMFIMTRDGFQGLISNSGTWIMPPFHQEIKHLCIDLFAAKTDDKYKVYTNYGAYVYPNGVDEVFCAEELLLVRKQDRWGVISKTGNTIVPVKYESLGEGFKNGICIAKFEGKYGLISKTGETLLFFEYDEVDPDFNFYRTAKKEKFKLNGKWVELELPAQ